MASADRHIRVLLLGSPEVTVRESPLDVDTRKAVALLAYLAMGDRPVRRQTLVGLLWPELDESRARGALRRTLSVLRTGLGEGVMADRETISLDRAAMVVDVAEFRRLVRSVSEHGHAVEEVCPDCVAPLQEAAALVRGEFLEGFSLRDSPDFDMWHLEQSESIRRETDRVLDRLALAAAAAGSYEAAIAAGRRRLAIDPLLEDAHRQLMLLHGWNGDRASALRQYRECVAVLDRELGVGPLDITTELMEAISEDDLPPAPGARRPTTIRPPRRDAVAPPPRPFVGREDELEAALSALEVTGSVVLVIGEAGSGRSRFVEELIESVGEEGGPVAQARGRVIADVPAVGTAAALLRSLVSRLGVGVADGLSSDSRAALGPLVPELGLAASRRRVAPPRDRFFTEIAQAILGAVRGGLVVVDDLAAVDEGSLEILIQVVAGLIDFDAAFVAAVRSDNPTTAYRIASAAESDGAVSWITMHRFDLDAMKELAGSVLGHDVDDEVVSRVAELSEGLPVVAAAYLDGLRGSPGAVSELPIEVRSVIESRLSAISEPGRQVLAAAAVLDGTFDPDRLRAVAGRSDSETADAVDELLQAGLLREEQRDPGAGLGFSHRLYRRHVYESVSLTRRRQLHGRAADALSAPGRVNRAAPEVIASHLELAGRHRESASHHFAAAMAASATHANAQALAHLDAAVAQGHPEPAAVHEMSGDLHRLAGHYGEAVAAYHAAAGLAPSPSLERKLGALYVRAGRWDLARHHLEAAAEMMERATPQERARLLIDRGMLEARLGEADVAMEHATEAKRTAPDDQSVAAHAANLMGVASYRSGEPAAAERHLRQALDASSRHGDLPLRVAAANNLGLVLHAAGRPDEAVTLAEQAVDLSVRMGDRHAEAAARSNLADHLRTAGRNAESIEALKDAVGLFPEIGVDPEKLEPEIWKLTHW